MEDPLQIIIVVIIMVVGAIRWFIENVVQKGKQPEDEADGGTLEDLYEEARREILDRQARMYPENEESPETDFIPEQEFRPIPRSTPPPLPEKKPTPAASFYPTFKATDTVDKPALSAAEQAALDRVQEREILLRSNRSKRRSGSTSGIRAMLATPQATRKAVLLREILGPPKGAPEQGL